MKVILSWSGQKSKEVALALYKWLPDVIQAVVPWMSESDIDIGLRWITELDNVLEENDFGILCLTRECLGAPWIHYEAGALSKSVKKAHVCPYLLGLEPTDIKGPLANFQASRADKQDTLKLLQTINHAIETTGGPSLTDARLSTIFEKFWLDLELSLASILNSEQQANEPSRSTEDMLEEILKTVREQSRVISNFQKLSENVEDTTRGIGSLWPSESLRIGKVTKLMPYQPDIHESIPAEDLFNDAFMKKYTQYNSYGNMLAAASESFGMSPNFNSLINKPEWSEFIAKNTKFSNWNDMLVSAIGEWNLSKTTVSFTIS